MTDGFNSSSELTTEVESEMNLFKTPNNLIKLCTLALTGVLIAMPAHAQTNDRVKSAKPIAHSQMKASPCVNPMEPCGGQIFTLDVQKVKSLKLQDRDLKKYIMSQIHEQYPEASEETLEGSSGLLIALLASVQDAPDVEDIELELVKWPPVITFEFKIKIKFGK